MEINDLLSFTAEEHERLLKFYKLSDRKKLQNLIALKVMEEVGELAEEILALDSIQRTEKLANHKGDISHEIVDVIITTLILAENLGVDVKTELEKGIEKRRKRKY